MSSPLPSTGKSSGLVGRVLASERQPGVRYCLEQIVGEGGMGTAYLARRETTDGTSPVVVKVMHEQVLAGEIAPEIVAAKEVVALGRLNESVPPSPFVVRFVDAGALGSSDGPPVPWTAIEYVHGGIEGTTLEDRVTYSIHKTGYGFDAVRVAHAIRCLSAGLSAIHAVGVLHRDLTPGNVLCCGFGIGEIFKIADFGVARAIGTVATFEGVTVGTVGYSPPEAGGKGAGPPTDVFALAAVIYYVLTGPRRRARAWRITPRSHRSSRITPSYATPSTRSSRVRRRSTRASVRRRRQRSPTSCFRASASMPPVRARAVSFAPPCRARAPPTPRVIVSA
jgi:eukaryotic-like serine/threonine-protein kinase